MTRGLCHHTSYFFVYAPLLKNLCAFGEIVIIANVQKKIKTKLDNRGSSCIFVGYSTTHEIDVFRFYHTTTKHIHFIRDVIWLDRNYGTWKGIKTNTIKVEEDDFDEPGEFGRNDKDDEIFEIQLDVQQIIFEENPSVHASLRKLQTLYNDAPAATTTPQSLRSGRVLPQVDSVREEEEAIAISNFLCENVELLAGSDDVLDMVELTTFLESWNHPDPIQHEKCRTAIRK